MADQKSNPTPEEIVAAMDAQPAPQATVSMPQVSPADLAAHALKLLETAPMQANEASLIVAIQLRHMLAGIAGGQLVVGRPTPPQAAKTGLKTVK